MAWRNASCFDNFYKANKLSNVVIISWWGIVKRLSSSLTSTNSKTSLLPKRTYPRAHILLPNKEKPANRKFVLIQANYSKKCVVLTASISSKLLKMSRSLNLQNLNNAFLPLCRQIKNNHWHQKLSLPRWKQSWKILWTNLHKQLHMTSKFKLKISSSPQCKKRKVKWSLINSPLRSKAWRWAIIQKEIIMIHKRTPNEVYKQQTRKIKTQSHKKNHNSKENNDH